MYMILLIFFYQGDGDFRCYWVGGTRNIQDQFVYDDRSPVNMANYLWGSGEPDNSGYNEDCLVLYGPEYRLYDFDCTSICRFFCEIP